MVRRCVHLVFERLEEILASHETAVDHSRADIRGHYQFDFVTGDPPAMLPSLKTDWLDMAA
jgi:hypothetical protein